MENMDKIVEKLDAIDMKLGAIIKINLLRAVYPKDKLDLYDDQLLKDLVDMGIEQQIISDIQELLRKWEEE